MSKLGTVTFTGKTGRKYEFKTYTWGTSFKKGYHAVYFVTKRSRNSEGGYSHERIYIGQTEDLSTRFDDHHKQDCFDRNEANCICVYGEKNDDNRLAIEKDLIDNYDPSCNG